jgi:hypothetical protein
MSKLAGKSNARRNQALLARLVAWAEGPPVTAPDLKIKQNPHHRLMRDLVNSGPFILVDAIQETLEPQRSARAIREAIRELGGKVPTPWSHRDFVTFQHVVRAFLRNLVTNEPPDRDVPPPSLGVGHLDFEVWPLPSLGVRIVVLGSSHDQLTLRVVQLVETTGIDRLRRCDCGRVFAKTGRREFCSVRCQKRIYMRKIRREERERFLRRTHAKTTRKK